VISRTNGRGGLFPRPSTSNYLSLRRSNLTTAVNLQPKTCGHAKAIVRNVTAPGGAAGYICRSCYAHLRAVEVRAIEVDRVRCELAGLFRNYWPLGINPGAAPARIVQRRRAA
jgi:hypothetical protein